MLFGGLLDALVSFVWYCGAEGVFVQRVAEAPHMYSISRWGSYSFPVTLVSRARLVRREYLEKNRKLLQQDECW